ncbi:hypothetical protein FSP39_002898 [Pinctada imbricata]|uniref:Peroxisomal trans-2-enoyl-CoA reductase n=1 Tax=Pinctada imbricata TaxID=66713 RepID=A0AA89BR54_PINIB|nr:hypothetical protein FSP39_002898 [Pinctada imbricata]
MAAPYTVNNVASVFRRGLFNEKVAIVTGGGTGIGKTITQELLYLGCKVMIAARNLERLQRAVDNFFIPEGSDASVTCMKCNIRRENEVRDLISGTVSRFGKLDFLVNNSGGQFGSPSSELSYKGWNAVIDLNLTGTFLVSREGSA